jgi:hypothetical protein
MTAANDTRKLYAVIRGELLHAASLKEISDLYCEIRDETGEGCSTFMPVNVYRAGAGTPDLVGHISYNGRVWSGPGYDGHIAPCVDNSVMLFDSRQTIALEA